MSNNKQSGSVDFLFQNMFEISQTLVTGMETQYELMKKAYEQAKAMQQEQAQQYATFVLKCVQNNLPPITFNDWINLENNEQPTTT